MFQESQELPMTWSFMVEMIRNIMEIYSTFWKFAERTLWHSMLKRCNSKFQRFPSLVIHGVTQDCSPNPKKIEAVKRMEMLQDVETMRSFLGLVNYLKRFSPHLAELSDPLREISRQKMEFKLTPGQRKKFPKMSHFHISIQTLPLFYKLMHPRKDWELYFYRIPNQWCLHPEHWLEVRRTIKTLNKST